MTDQIRTITLPSGKTAAIRTGTGKDIRIAGRHTNPAQDRIGYSFALIAQLVTIDGKPIVPEDLDEMNMDDVSVLMKETVAGNSPTPETSSI